jgi:hypothetical protein
MDEVIAHVQENLTGYLIVLGCALPIIIIFRKQTFPFIGLCFESALYFSIIHLILAGIVRFFGWFKKESTFERALSDGNPNLQQSFTTPLTEPWWDKTLYHPEGLIYLELAFIVLVIIVTFKYRPLDVGGKNTYQGKAATQAAKQKAGQRTCQKYTRPPRRK